MEWTGVYRPRLTSFEQNMSSSGHLEQELFKKRERRKVDEKRKNCFIKRCSSKVK
jgi:hypothetical protein